MLTGTKRAGAIELIVRFDLICGRVGSDRSWPESGAGSTGHCNTALSLSAGVSNPKVFLGRWFRRNAILFKYD